MQRKDGRSSKKKRQCKITEDGEKNEASKVKETTDKSRREEEGTKRQGGEEE